MRRPADEPRGGPFRPLLAGGDRRSLARAPEVLGAALADRRRVGEIVALTGDPDALVAMRALDLLEKLARARPAWVHPHRGVFLGPLADSDRWELRLQVVRALPLLRLLPDERRRAVAILERDLGHPQAFVRAWALDGLGSFALEDPTLVPTVRAALEALDRSGGAALRARARKVRARLSGLPGGGGPPYQTPGSKRKRTRRA